MQTNLMQCAAYGLRTDKLQPPPPPPLDINDCVLSLFLGDSKFTQLYKLYTHYFTF